MNYLAKNFLVVAKSKSIFNFRLTRLTQNTIQLIIKVRFSIEFLPPTFLSRFTSPNFYSIVQIAAIWLPSPFRNCLPTVGVLQLNPFWPTYLRLDQVLCPVQPVSWLNTPVHCCGFNSHGQPLPLWLLSFFFFHSSFICILFFFLYLPSCSWHVKKECRI